MKIFPLLIFLVGIVAGASLGEAAPEEFFIGDFQSDKEATIARWKAEQPFGEKTQRFIDAFGKILGKCKAHTTRTHVKTENDGFDEEQPYEVVERTERMVRIRSFSSVYKRYLVDRLEATDDGYWVFSELVKGYCEKFRRVSSNQGGGTKQSEAH